MPRAWRLGLARGSRIGPATDPHHSYSPMPPHQAEFQKKFLGVTASVGTMFQGHLVSRRKQRPGNRTGRNCLAGERGKEIG